MMNQKLFKAGICLMMAGSLGSFSSCQQDLSEDEHYKSPDFLVGNAIEVLQKDGNCKTFLKGIELIGYNDVVDSQILTVLAPNDEAFASFLQKKGYNSIEEMYQADPEYTRQMITYHLLYYAMDWEKMTNFRPSEGDGATELDKATRAGMYNRFRTRCQMPITIEPNNNPKLTADSTLSVIHWDRYVTVFSEKMFKTLGIDAASNYKYFFPNSSWNPNHLANGFNVMNAAVLDTVAVVTDNGYLYHIDQVIEPVGTIYEELKNQGNYDKIVDLYDVFAYYAKETNESENLGYPIYVKSFTGLPGIAAEWPSINYKDFLTNSSTSWNLFIPTDQAFEKMYKDYWYEGCGYSSIDSLNPLIKKVLLLECVSSIEIEGSRDTYYMCYPDYIRKNRAISYFGTTITTDPSEFDVNLFCNNGVVYGSNTMAVPDVFLGVAGPVFKDVKYLPYLYALNGAESLLSLSSKESNFIALIPDTAQFTHHDPAMRLFKDIDAIGDPYSLQQWSDKDGDFLSISGEVTKAMANMNLTTEATELKKSGIQVIETNESFNFWYVRDGQITTNAIFNEQLNPTFNGKVWSDFEEIKSNASGDIWSNGRCYAYNYTGVFMPASGNLETELCQCNNRNYPYYCFSQLLRKAGLVKETEFQDMLKLDKESHRFFAIIPTNDAIKASLKSLPGCSALSINDSTYTISGSDLSKANAFALANYLCSYFVTADRNTFRSYPYVGSSCNGQFETPGQYSLNIIDDGTDLHAKFGVLLKDTPVGNEVKFVNKYNYLPFAYSDGAFQMIDEVLK